ncbi:hypothetical protein ACVBE9_00870 [Eionea flava]
MLDTYHAHVEEPIQQATHRKLDNKPMASLAKPLNHFINNNNN